ncbi:caspase family protein [Allomesorhizobium camelthorni]|uniref:Caspase family protein n=1 Tax=Allomesorhizobium camelthorni TaxID=475069 RepID=A0A6G4WF30_9HYPH|nr:caspase family protein [Mesorhizobium camelthorni]NGO52958.1 caspase family protein [Mesorhizobium camelthorni]
MLAALRSDALPCCWSWGIVIVRRRTFLGGTAVFLSGFPWAQGFARPEPRTHAAIVIGVQDTSGLPSLFSAIPQAKMFSNLLTHEGYDVRLHIDQGISGDERRNLLHAIKTSVSTIADPTTLTLTQLVIYFTGHGLWSPQEGDVWLLPNALSDSDQAIHVRSLEQLAYTSGIRNVVIVSDACRSPANDYGQQLIKGSGLLPTNDRNSRVDIDWFYSSRWAKPAYEVEVAAQKFESIFSKAMLNAFTDPPDWILSDIDGRSVIPNEMLKEFLYSETERLTVALGLYEDVSPFISTASSANVYIAGPYSLDTIMNETDTMIETDTGWLQRTPSDQQVFAQVFAQTGLPVTTTKSLPRTDEYEANLEQRIHRLQEQQQKITPMRDLDLGAASAGIAIYNGLVADVAGSTEVHSLGRRREGRDGEGVYEVSIFGAEAAETGETAILSFANGSGCVLALLRGYIAHVFADESGVDMIAYEPIPGSDAHYEFQAQGDRLRDLRSLLTLALRNGVFGIDNSLAEASGDAESFADQIRYLKFSDPTLGIYAAYAYAQAGIQEEVREILEIQTRGNLIARIFDNVLLAQPTRAEGAELLAGVVPFCPMLRNGWEFLRVKGVGLPEAVNRAGPYLRNSVWTSFDQPGIEILMDALRSGEI